MAGSAVWIWRFVGCGALLAAVGTASARPAAKPLAVAQLEFPAPLVAPGERPEVGYDTRKIPAATGFLYVRNNLQHVFIRVPLRLRKGSQQQVSSDRLRLLRGVVPARMVRGHRLFYYAVVHDPKSGRSVRVPAGSVESAWVLTGARIVRLGTHRFGHLRSPEAVVARAGPKDVGFDNPPQGAKQGPWSFDVAPDRSVWLLDEFNKRLLVWAPGEPNASPRVVPLASFYPVDFALGPAGSIYVTGCPGTAGRPFIQHLCRLAAGRVLWTTTLATDVFNTQLRLGPDGTLYMNAPVPNSPRTERGGPTNVWMPVATRDGKPLSPAQQRRRSLGGYQPQHGGLRLVWTITRFEKDWAYGRAPHEERFALIDPTRGRLVRSWRITSRTVIWPHPEATPALLGGNPVVLLEVTGSGKSFKDEYVVLRLAQTASGTLARFSLPHGRSAEPKPARAAWGDVITDLRIGPGAKLYQLGSSPTTGVKIYRYSLAPG